MILCGGFGEGQNGNGVSLDTGFGAGSDDAWPSTELIRYATKAKGFAGDMGLGWRW